LKPALNLGSCVRLHEWAIVKNLYPWYQLASDISIALGMNEDLEQGLQLKIATELNRDIQTGLISCWTEHGDPIRGPVPLELQRKSVPHITKEIGNEWLSKNLYLYKWEPVESHVHREEVLLIEFSLLATREKLLEAYGQFGLKREWFKDLHSREWLLYAREVKGHGQRGSKAAALFCPFKVMQGLINKVRGMKRISPDTAWRIFEHKFPEAYEKFSINDPR